MSKSDIVESHLSHLASIALLLLKFLDESFDDLTCLIQVLFWVLGYYLEHILVLMRELWRFTKSLGEHGWLEIVRRISQGDWDLSLSRYGE